VAGSWVWMCVCARVVVVGTAAVMPQTSGHAATALAQVCRLGCAKNQAGAQQRRLPAAGRKRKPAAFCEDGGGVLLRLTTGGVSGPGENVMGCSSHCQLPLLLGPPCAGWELPCWSCDSSGMGAGAGGQVATTESVSVCSCAAPQPIAVDVLQAWAARGPAERRRHAWQQSASRAVAPSRRQPRGFAG
jgi:hypothetical protein